MFRPQYRERNTEIHVGAVDPVIETLGPEGIASRPVTEIDPTPRRCDRTITSTLRIHAAEIVHAAGIAVGIAEKIHVGAVDPVIETLGPEGMASRPVTEIDPTHQNAKKNGAERNVSYLK
jgi:hypothetical protein